MASLIHFRVTFGKWLESACSAVICGLYDGIGAAGARVYAGRFTYFFGDFILEKQLSNPSICQAQIFDLPNPYRPKAINVINFKSFLLLILQILLP